MTWKKQKGLIRIGKTPVLESVPETVRLVPDKTGTGTFLSVEAPTPSQFWPALLGTVANMERFTACYRREETFWMEPCAGTTLRQVPGDTQWLLVRRTDGKFVLLVPIIDDALRFCLDGRDGTLRLWADSGDPWTIQRSGVGAFLAVGDDPYRLQEAGASAVMRRLKTGKLRRDKPLPDFVDLFGWCTWNAFYADVSADKVRQGLESFRAGGIPPAFMILDDGWLSFRTMPVGGNRLTSFRANSKFPEDLAPVVAAAKQEFGVRRFLVWHAIMGYWAGADREAFPDYDICEIVRNDLPSFGRDMGPMFPWMGLVCGVIAPDKIADFYDAFHSHLAAQGVDGVKVDNQSTIELSAARLGGRVRLTRAYRRGLEESCRRHFAGRLINCMSNANETHLMAGDSTLLRTSTDFWPLRPETHGTHLYTNSQVDMWFGQFVHPDWDMFESGHKMGAYHAAGRAVSGSPVYVSDKPDGHDFDVLRKLVCSDGTVLRCTDIGRPSPDCLFHDPTREDVLLKIFNFNAHGAVLGVFHAKHDGGKAGAIAGTVSLKDIPGLAAGQYAVLAHRSGAVRVLGTGRRWPVRMKPGEWEIFTFAALNNGHAVLGLADRYNSGGAIVDLHHGKRLTSFRIRDGGILSMYSAEAPVSVTAGGATVSVHHDRKTGRITATIPAPGLVTVRWR